MFRSGKDRYMLTQPLLMLDFNVVIEPPLSPSAPPHGLIHLPFPVPPSHQIDQEAASFVATTVEYHLREILEDAIKLQNQSKRHSLTVDDLNFVMRLRGQQPLYGYGAGAAATQEVTTTDGEQATVVLSGLGERKETLVRAMQTELPKVVGRMGGNGWKDGSP